MMKGSVLVLLCIVGVIWVGHATLVQGLAYLH
jgi:hypothetical protein